MANGNNNTLDILNENRVVVAVARIASVIGIPVGIALLGWLSLSIADARRDIAVLAYQVESFQRTITNMYRLGDAEKDLKLRDLRIDTLSATVNGLDKRMEKLENQPLYKEHVR